MSDDLLRRIAEIDDNIHCAKPVDLWEDGLNRICGRCLFNEKQHPIITIDWDPLTNWEDCGPLIEKYAEHLLIDRCAWETGRYTKWQVQWAGMDSVLIEEPDIKTAIVKAIIAAHEEP